MALSRLQLMTLSAQIQRQTQRSLLIANIGQNSYSNFTKKSLGDMKLLFLSHRINLKIATSIFSSARPQGWLLMKQMRVHIIKKNKPYDSIVVTINFAVCSQQLL
jgi:outer membrane lipopolysaccharide assembly protein LptE/RlpB